MGSQLKGLPVHPANGSEDVPLSLLARVRAIRAQDGLTDWDSEDQSGRRLGRFELLNRLGSGSFGHVYRARDIELGRIVAIKIPKVGNLVDVEDAARFAREARSAARLAHPGIVALHETGQAEDGSYFLVEEFIEGSALSTRIGPQPGDPRAAAELLALVGEALDYAHRMGVIHRDIKPSNIQLDLEGRPHLMDFGLAKRVADDASMTQEGQVLGTPAYMSPEQARGESRLVDERSDIYSLGVVLYELLTGERPFGGNRRLLLLQVLEDEPRPPRQLNHRIPRDLETVCLKAMAKAPARRYASARDFVDDLRRFLAGEPIRARPISIRERLWHWRRRNPIAASLLATVTLGSAFGLWHLSLLSEQLVKSTAIESAAQQSEMLDVVNALYSAQVVDRIQGHGIAVTHDYTNHDAAIPLPATFTIESGEEIGKRSKTGMVFRLYSDYPFRSRADGGPHDEFERWALDQLRRAPALPVTRFERFRDRPALRYATARVMEANCIGCHNNDANSTKRDWKVGDVGGVLEIIRPLDRDIARTHEGLRGTFLLIAGVTTGMLMVCGLTMLIRTRRKTGPS
jgi:serine/threonine protein kinase